MVKASNCGSSSVTGSIPAIGIKSIFAKKKFEYEHSAQVLIFLFRYYLGTKLSLFMGENILWPSNYLDILLITLGLKMKKNSSKCVHTTAASKSLWSRSVSVWKTNTKKYNEAKSVAFLNCTFFGFWHNYVCYNVMPYN